MGYDLASLGETMLRLWVPAGERLEDAAHYRVGLGGAEGNTAAAVARHGLSTAWISRLPDNPLGRRAARCLAGQGVDVSHVIWDRERRMGVYFLELSGGVRPVSVLYDRKDSAAAALSPEDVAWEVVEQAGAVHLTGITLGISESARRTVLEAADRARRAGAKAVVDVNYRSRLWTPEEAAPAVLELCRRAEVVIATREDARDLYGIDGAAEEAAVAVKELTGAGAAIITDGAAGAAWEGGTAYGQGKRGGYQTPVLDRVGAGDAFAAGVIIGLVRTGGKAGLTAGVERGLAMAAAKLGVFGDCLTAYPEEIDLILTSDPRRPGREVSR